MEKWAFLDAEEVFDVMMKYFNFSYLENNVSEFPNRE